MTLNLPYPFWAPTICYIIIILQGMHLRTIWVRQLHRLLGTAGGMAVAWGLLSIPFPPIAIPFIIFAMLMWIETMVARHYALAVVMITPLTMYVSIYSQAASPITSTTSTASNLSNMVYNGMIEARFWDTLLGCLLALFGGLLMHTTAIYRPLARLENRLSQSKFFKK